jgi:hypothetical protein
VSLTIPKFSRLHELKAPSDPNDNPANAEFFMNLLLFTY